MYYLKASKISIASLFEAKNLHLGAYLAELSHSSEDWMRTAYICHKINVKVQLKYLISSKQGTKKQFF